MIKKRWVLFALPLLIWGQACAKTKENSAAIPLKKYMFKPDPVATAKAQLGMKIGQVFSRNGTYVNDNPIGIQTVFLGVNRDNYFILEKQYAGRPEVEGKKATDLYLSEPLTLSGDQDAKIRGLYIRRYPDGSKLSECYYEEKHSAKDRPCLGWHNNGNKSVKMHYTLVEAWVDTSGTEPSSYRWVLDGDYQSWFPSGEKNCVGKYNAGKPIGTLTCWYRNGQKRSEGYYGDKSSPVKVIYWHENGQKSAEETRLKGKKIDIWRKWSGNGTLLEEASYKDGSLDGPFTQWYENGQKQMEGQYKYSECIGEERVGIWRYWNKNGALLYKSKFTAVNCKRLRGK